MFKIRCIRRHQAHKLLPKASNRCPPSNIPTVSTVSTGTSTASLPGESLRTVIQILLRGSHTLVFFLRGKYKIHFQCNSITTIDSRQLFCFTFSRKPFYVGSANSHEVSPPTHTLHHSGAPHAGHGAFSSHTAQRTPKDRGIPRARGRSRCRPLPGFLRGSHSRGAPRAAGSLLGVALLRRRLLADVGQGDEQRPAARTAPGLHVPRGGGAGPGRGTAGLGEGQDRGGEPGRGGRGPGRL